MKLDLLNDHLICSMTAVKIVIKFSPVTWWFILWPYWLMMKIPFSVVINWGLPVLTFLWLQTSIHLDCAVWKVSIYCLASSLKNITLGMTAKLHHFDGFRHAKYTLVSDVAAFSFKPLLRFLTSAKMFFNMTNITCLNLSCSKGRRSIYCNI